MHILLTAVLMVFFSCTKTEPIPTVQDSGKGREAAAQSGDIKSLPTQPDQTRSVIYQDSTGTLPVRFEEASLRSTFQVATESLSYRFQYIDIVRQGPLTFINGSAEIKIQGLPVGKSGLLKLEIYEASKLAIIGEKANVTLQAGANSEKLVLSKVDENSRGGISIDLKLDNIRSLIDGTPLPPTPPSPGPTPGAPDPIDPPSGPQPELDAKGQAAMAVIIKHCSECHHSGRPNVFTQLPFKSATSNDSKVIMQKIIATSESGTMPPQPRDRLTAEEIATLKAWQIP